MSQRYIHRGLAVLVGALGMIALYSSVAYASGPPVITGTSMTNFRLNAATVTGSIDPNGAAVSYKVEYGKTKLYGQSTPTISPNNIAPVSVSEMVIGLEPMTTYHFRLSATNSSGTTVSGDMVGELLLSWKVGGTLVSKLASPATYKDEHEAFGGSVSFEGTFPGGGKGYVLCDNQTKASEGSLGIEYKNYTYGWCGVMLNEKWLTGCKSTGPVTLQLNAFLAQSEPMTIPFNKAECLLGGKLIFGSGGYGARATEEERTVWGEGMEGVTYSSGLRWNTLLSSGVVSLTGTYKGKVFGIS